jgi:hypothetical protein
MTHRNRWYAESVAVINKAINDSPPGETPELRRKRISTLYPFGERQYWPYKEWLLAMAEAGLGSNKANDARLEKLKELRDEMQNEIEFNPLFQKRDKQ